MPSLIPGFEYDIFISYRHNDNRSGWVTEFVNALREELAATIKDQVSVYFDSNPYDGLLETHNVDKSLEGKLKCLIFIPIISQTYCDPKSFAWQHEFVAFNKLTREEHLGRDIKLNNGNVASRILPIKIHDIDSDDKAIIENEIGGVLRAIEFIYKEAGVNRPLKSTDNKNENLNKTDYRNQVNKVANAIKELIGAIQNPTAQAIRVKSDNQSVTESKNKKSLIVIGASVLTLLIIGYFLYPKLFSRNNSEVVIDKSIAVLPFVNMSGDPEQEYFSDGLSEELLNSLSKVPELKVIARTSSFAFKGTNEDVRSIAAKLGVKYILEGSVRQSDDQVRITAQLIKAEDGSHVWSHNYDRKREDILSIQDDISRAIAASLNNTFRDLKFNASTSPEVHELLLKSSYYWNKGDSLNQTKAMELLEQALAIDSLNATLLAKLSIAYYALEKNKADEVARKAFTLDPDNETVNWAMGMARVQAWDWSEADKYLDKALMGGPLSQGANGKIRNAARLGKFDEAIRVGIEAIQFSPLNRGIRYHLGIVLIHIGKYDEALVQASKLEEIGTSPTWPYELKATVYLLQKKNELALTEVMKLPEGRIRSYFLCLTYSSLKDKRKADAELKNYLTRYEKTKVAFSIGEIYSWRGEPDEAMRWLETAYSRREAGLYNINISAWLRPMKTDQRFKEMVSKMNLPLLD